MTHSTSLASHAGGAHTCDFCGGAHPLNLYILGYTVCASCERCILTAKVGDKTYRRIRQVVSEALATAQRERTNRA